MQSRIQSRIQSKDTVKNALTSGHAAVTRPTIAADAVASTSVEVIAVQESNYCLPMMHCNHLNTQRKVGKMANGSMV